MRIDKTTLQTIPKSTSKLELAYCLINEAEKQEVSENGRFRAMDCHTDILDLAELDYGVRSALQDLGMSNRISKNQIRLGIV